MGESKTSWGEVPPFPHRCLAQVRYPGHPAFPFQGITVKSWGEVDTKIQTLLLVLINAPS